MRSASGSELRLVRHRSSARIAILLRVGTAVAAVAGAPTRSTSPESYTPKHLAEKIISSKSSLEGERKQITVLDDLPLDRVLSVARGSAAIPRSRVSRIRVIRSEVRRRARSIFCS